MRLFPFICSIASVFLFRKTASRLLSGLGLFVAVAIFSVSYPGIRYAAEAKPYGSDLFISLGLLFLTVEWLARRAERWLWWLACLTPLAIGLSYPAVFAAGGFSLVVAACLWKHGGARSEWRAWAVWNLALVAGFGFCFWLSGRVQAGAESEFMTRFWSVHFPPVRQPWKLPLWLLQTHASDFLAYPVGGPNWASSLTLIFVLVGVWRLCQRQRRAFGTAAGSLRTAFSGRPDAEVSVRRPREVFAVPGPAICCLAAVGVVESCAFWSRRGLPVRRSLACAATLLALVGLSVVVRDVALPYKTQSDYRERAFAQGFWFPAERDAEVACLKSDFGLDFVPDQFKDLSWSAQYLCNQAIEKSRYHLKRPDLSRVSLAALVLRALPRVAVQIRRSTVRELAGRDAGRYDLVGRDSVSLPACGRMNGP